MIYVLVTILFNFINTVANVRKNPNTAVNKCLFLE